MWFWLAGAGFESAELGVAWRFAAVWGSAVGLALAPLAGSPAPWPALAVVAALVALARPGPGGAGRSRPIAPAAAAVWLAAVAIVAAIAGLGLGDARIAARDAGALTPPPGPIADLRGYVAASPELDAGALSFPLATTDGRILVGAADPSRPPRQGDEVVVSGDVREPPPWLAAGLARAGISRVVERADVEPTGERRGGVSGVVDSLRRRAEDALAAGTSGEASALLEGFVLGRDDLISEPVTHDFRRSGLSHILAVSGQNVVLLVLLATPVLALLGVPFRLRVGLLVALIAIYVPVAGAGPSIQRAGVMGAAALAAGLAGRPRSRLFALALAAVATLALEPRATADPGWQLSFAAVTGIAVLAPRLCGLFAGAGPSPVRRAGAEALALTLAATLATLPIVAATFGTLSLTTLPANLLAAPAVAPAMWLGMLAAALGQIPGFPVGLLVALGGDCAGYIAWIAHALGGPGAQAEVREPGPAVAVALAMALVLGAATAAGWLARRRRPRLGRLAPALALLGTAAIGLIALGSGGQAEPPPLEGPVLRVTLLDVGQGDSILIEAPAGETMLVDTGAPGQGVASLVARQGVDRLDVVVLTHDELDHDGALGELLASVTPRQIIVAPGGVPEACASIRCPAAHRVAAGSEIRLGSVRLDVLWPPPGPAPPADPEAGLNSRSLVMVLRWRHFRMLLTGDAEAELAPVSPGPIDVLKVAHHGSADAGLEALLDRTGPELALISVGAANDYGHPTEATLGELEAHGVAVTRTDESGALTVEAWRNGYRLVTGG